MSFMKHESYTIFGTTDTLDASELLQAGTVECASPSTAEFCQANNSLSSLPKGHALHADTLRWPEVALQNSSGICPNTRTYHVSSDSNHIHSKAKHAPITIFCNTTVGSIIHTLSVCAPG